MITATSRPAEIAERYREIEGKLFPWQREHTKQLIRSLHRTRDALDASDTGTGKTFCALASMYALDLPCLVVCPYSLLDVWKQCAEILGVPDPHVINYEMLRTGRTRWGEWVGKRFQWNIVDARTLIIFDECHRLKDYRTLQCELGLSAVKAGFYVMGLSATAADNPMHMKFIVTLAKLIPRADAFFGWMLRHGVRRVPIGRGRRTRQILQFTGGKKVLTYLHSQLFPLHGSRMRIADIPDFPKTTIMSETYKMPEGAAIQRVYEEMRKELAELRKRAENYAANALVVRLHARQQIELLKVPTLVTLAKDGAAEGMSVIIFVNYEATLQALSYRLKTFCVVHGEQKGSERTDWVSRFQKDVEPYLVANIKAGGIGLGYHGKRPRLVLLSPSDSAIDVRQALGRAPRAGGNWSIQKIVWAAGTVEEDSAKNTRRKLRHIDTLNDGDLAPELTF